MIRRKVVIVLLSALPWLAVMPSPAAAEWFADLFVGPAFTQSDDLNLKKTAIGTIQFKDVDFKNVVSFGGRGGYWFESTPYLGLGLDVSHFRPDIKRQTPTTCLLGACFSIPLFRIDLEVTGISFDALLRWPLLTDKNFPNGQLQPYLTIGPTVFVARAKESLNFIPPRQPSDTDTSVGVKAGAGTAWQFHKNVALFGEYRFTHFNPEFSLRDVGLGKFTAKAAIDTHRAVFGVSFRFY